MAERLHRLYLALLDRIERVPGVESASLARPSPLAPSSYGFQVALPAGGARRLPALIVYPRYFQAMGIPVVKGRDFNADDLRPGSPFAVLVNEAFVREFLGGREPLGVRERLVATLSGGFGLVALALVSIGLYGVLAFTVSRRTAEIGIRVALGATRLDVSWLIGRQALAIVLLGLRSAFQAPGSPPDSPRASSMR